MSVPDPYKVLQVDPEADREVIEAAYKRLARKHHPDVSHDPDSVQRMVRINQAWEMLRDPARRATVDRARARAAATSARVVAADAKADVAAARGRPSTANAAVHPQEPTPGGPAGAPRWPFPGMQDPRVASFGARAERVSGAWTSGRSDVGYRYDAGSMGVGSAGPPPGNPSGSVVTFGRYEGWTLGEIARTDLEYLEWLDRMPIGRTYQAEIDGILRRHGRRVATVEPDDGRRGLFRRR